MNKLVVVVLGFLCISSCFIGKLSNRNTGGCIYGKLHESFPFQNTIVRLIGTDYETKPDFRGNYSLKNIPVGKYKLTFIVNSFQYFVISDLVVKENEVSFVPVALPGDVYGTTTYTNYGKDIKISYKWKKRMIHKNELDKPCKVTGDIGYIKSRDKASQMKHLDSTPTVYFTRGNRRTFYSRDEQQYKVYTTQTNTKGYYTLDSLPCGIYSATYSYKDHRTRSGYYYFGILVRPDSVAVVNMDRIPSVHQIRTMTMPFRKWQEKYLSISNQ